MKNTKLKGNIILFITAIIWGTTFIMQRQAMKYIGPYTFNFLRSGIAFVILVLVYLMTKNKIKIEEGKPKKIIHLYAVLAGIAMFIASSFQQLSLVTIDASVSGFITSTYLVFVPIFGLIFKQKVKMHIWLCVVICIIGSYLLSGANGMDVSIGSLLSFFGAIFFAFQILFVDFVNKYINPFKLCAIEIGIVCVLSFVMMLIYDNNTISGVILSLPYVLYAAILSGCIAYSMQIIGQKYAPPSIASLIMSLEAVFALIAGVLFLHEAINFKEAIGVILIFASIIISQLNFTKKVI